jgi:uncharacterized protein YndB with AHSA1/START domain
VTMTTTHETEIIVDPDVPLVRIIREFDAPPSKVFRAHTDPELAAQWMGPRGYTNEIDEWDARTGGAWRYRCVTPDGEQAFYGSFHELRPDEVIVQTFCWAGMPDGVALERLVLEDLGDGRTRLVATSLVDSFEARDAFVSSGMEVGIKEGYERLDEILAAGSNA